MSTLDVYSHVCLHFNAKSPLNLSKFSVHQRGKSKKVYPFRQVKKRKDSEFSLEQRLGHKFMSRYLFFFFFFFFLLYFMVRSAFQLFKFVIKYATRKGLNNTYNAKNGIFQTSVCIIIIQFAFNKCPWHFSGRI